MKRRVTREEIIRTTRDLIIRNGIRAARGDEIALVAESIRTAVKDRFGIELMPEVKYVG